MDQPIGLSILHKTAVYCTCSCLQERFSHHCRVPVLIVRHTILYIREGVYVSNGPTSAQTSSDCLVATSQSTLAGKSWAQWSTPLRPALAAFIRIDDLRRPNVTRGTRITSQYFPCSRLLLTGSWSSIYFAGILYNFNIRCPIGALL